MTMNVNRKINVLKHEKKCIFVPLLFVGPRYEVERWQFWFIMGTYGLLLLNVFVSDVNYLFCIWFVSKQRPEYFPIALWIVESIKNLCLVFLLGLGEDTATPIAVRKVIIVGVTAASLMGYFFIGAFIGTYAWMTCLGASISIGFLTILIVKKLLQT
jgi:hypothetical protein